MEAQEMGDFGNPDEDILKYLMEDTTDGSSPDSTPPSMFEDSSTPDSSPSHWSQGVLTPPTVPQLSELSLDLNSELLLYGSNVTLEYDTFLSVPHPSELKGITIQPIVQPQIPLVPIVQPPIHPLPIVQPPQQQPVPIVEPPLLRKNRTSSKKRQRAEESPTVPSPQDDNVALPRDTLLQITSQSMEKYVETLQSSRNLSMDDQKELKRQKRLIKNRESAQLSRERKRAYIDQLEARIAQLQSENSKLSNDNASLRQSLSKYQPDIIKTEPGTSEADNAMQQHLTKMGSLISVGGNRSAAATKAGVCLLIVLFSFGLFMNANNPSAITKFAPQAPALTGAHVFSDRVLVPPAHIETVGVKRSLLEAFPEVKIEEENDTDPMYESPAKLIRSVPIPEQSSPKDLPGDRSGTRHHVIHLNTKTPAPPPTPSAHPRKIEISQAGIFKVSYSPQPANFVENEGEHSHDDPANSTYMLFLDRRPDLDDADMENDSAPVSSTHDTQLEVATPRVANRKEDAPLPPMIISLVIPDHFANGSNPLLLPEGLDPSESLMEITCQVIDISITTSERPRN